jgi:hypothetical protein
VDLVVLAQVFRRLREGFQVLGCTGLQEEEIGGDYESSTVVFFNVKVLSMQERRLTLAFSSLWIFGSTLFSLSESYIE